MFKFFKYKVKQLKTDLEFSIFANAFKKDMGYEVPANFLKKGKLWAVINPKGEYVGGFAFVAKHPLRSLEEIPPTYPIYLDPSLVAEVTAVWLKDKYYGFMWSLHFIYQAYRFPAKYFVYSYPISEVKLGKYYEKADPLCIYKGPIVRLEGHLENPEDESVEVITAWGVVKIALHRNIKYLKKFFK